MIGVILAGGKSSRFGSHKSLYPIENKPFYEHVYDAFVESGVDKIVLSSNKVLSQYFIDDIKLRGLNIEVIEDDINYKDCGPLSGIYSVMEAIQDSLYCVVSVDTPFITSEAIRYLINIAGIHSSSNAIVYQDDYQVHRTIAVYRYNLKNKIKYALDHKRYALKALTEDNVTHIHINRIKSTPFWFENINTKNDLERVLKIRGGYYGTN